MTEAAKTPPAQSWHTDDLLVRISRGEEVGVERKTSPVPAADDALPAAKIGFGKRTLALVADDPGLYERYSVRRSKAFNDNQLVAFGARTRSQWALDVLVDRKTDGRHSWDSFRAAVLDQTDSTLESNYVLRRMPLDSLWRIVEVLHERNVDFETELALLTYMAQRLANGSPIDERALEPLIERLLQAKLGDEARRLIPKLTKPDWMRHAFMTEVNHPRYGGSFDTMLRIWNEVYHRVALEPVVLRDDDEGAAEPFHRITAVPKSSASTGPLVTVIMTCWNPGIELFTAVRSIVSQTYQNWELIITDDASSEDVDDVLDQVAALDDRIVVVRNETNAGTYVRRNEAIQRSRGEFVTMQDSDDWSHPRRLEIQAKDLSSTPLRFANVVNAARMTEDLSVVSRRGAKLFLSEPALMFRREAVVNAIGYYDSVRKSADTEFRKRLQAVTKQPIPVVAPGVPLLLMLADETSLSGADFGTNIWNHPDRLVYWSATRHYLAQIEKGRQDPYLAFPADSRRFHAPVRWTRDSAGALKFDVLVVLDGREAPESAQFHRVVVQELEAAVDAGLRVAVAQSDAIVGPTRMTFFPPELQALIDSGVVSRITPEDEAEVDVVVVRHASSVQGHGTEKWLVRTSRVVVVEEPAGGDTRGSTIAKPDVVETVTEWFGCSPSWVVAPPSLPVPSVKVLEAAGGRLALTISTDVPRLVRRVSLVGAKGVKELVPTVLGSDGVTCEIPLTELSGGEWTISLDLSLQGDRLVSQSCALTDETTVWNERSSAVVKTESGAFILLVDDATVGLPTRQTFVTDYASASVVRVAVIDERTELAVDEDNHSFLKAVYAMRKANGFVIRRRDFTVTTSSDGAKAWQRPLAKFVDARWEIFGTFRTSIGDLEYPLSISGDATLISGERWEPNVFSGQRLGYLPPQPSKIVRASSRVARSVERRFGHLPVVSTFRKTGATNEESKNRREKIHFDPGYGAPRVREAPIVSVVMPVYNVEPYLQAAITSVLNQEVKDLELIIVDDASSDNGREIIAKYWRKDPRIRVFGLDHNTLGGAGIPSNIGIRAARGKYVAFADSDDYLTESGLGSMVKLAERHGAEIVIGDFKTFSDKMTEGTRAYDHAVWNEFPVGTPISAVTHPSLFRLSPVPWRKLYRRDFMEENGILYPEGDYFYEDNPLHWFVLSRAQNVVTCAETISFHRQEREGQTMSAQAYKLGSFVNHANTVLNFLTEGGKENRDVLFEAFYSYLDRTNWTVKSQTQASAAALIRRGLGDIYGRAVAAAPDAHVPPLIRAQLSTYRTAYPDVDLTIVVPVFNSADLLSQTLDSVLSVSGLRLNVLLVDDGSNDDSLTVMREYELRHDNVHVFAQGNRGAGRARNSLIPLCTGRYTFFLDADDVVRAESLAKAVNQADAEGADLMFVKYRIDFVDEGRSHGMFGSDRELWSQLQSAADDDERRRLVARLINYPWNRIISTSLLHDANIFFGATVVHNDVLFHWHTIASAQRIGHADVEVVAHKKFATREQVTNISDGRRMAVLEALRSTHERVSTLEGYDSIREEWKNFVLHLLEWAESRIPSELRFEYKERSKDLTAALRN